MKVMLFPPRIKVKNRLTEALGLSLLPNLARIGKKASSMRQYCDRIG